MPSEVRERIFISYSHKDKKWLERLQTMLEPLVHREMIKAWADANIEPGSRWQEEINNAIASAKVAVLLVSPNFLASDFIAKHELPAILEAAEKEGLIVFWIAVSYSHYQVTELAKYQAVNDASRPLDTLSPANWKKELFRICEKISQAVKTQHPTTNLQAVKPNNLPARTPFFGRKADINRVMEGLASHYQLISIEGMPGVGKTSLAIEVACAYACLPGAEPVPIQFSQHFSYVVWVSARSKLEQQRWLNEVLNIVAQVMKFFSITQRPPDHLEQKKSEVDQLLRSNPVLVIVDNFETMVDPDLVNWLENVPEPSKVLITTRQSLLKKTWLVELKGLEDGEALKFIRQEAYASALHFIEAESDDTLLSLVTHTGGNPKAIEMALGYIKEGQSSFHKVIEKLKEAGEEVEAIFAYLFERFWELLSENARKAFLVVPLFVGSFTKEAMRAASGLSPFEFGQALQQLVNMKLLDFNHDTQRYRIHPLTLAFANAKLTRDPEFQIEARKNWSEYYLNFVRENVVREKPPVPYWNALVDVGMEKLDAEWSNIYEVLNWASQEGEDQILLDFVMLLVHYMDSRFYNLERLNFVRKAVEAAHKMGRKEEEALLRIDALGWTYVEESRLKDASREISTGLDVVKQIIGENGESENTSDLLALGLSWQTRVMIEEGRSTEASQKIEEALAIPCRPWIRFRVKMAEGDVALKQGKNKEALQFYEESLQATQEYGTEGNEYQTAPRIGMAYLAMGKLDKAEEKFRALRDQQHIAIGKLYAQYGEAFLAYKKGDIAKAQSLAADVREELSLRKSSNLLLILIKKLFDDLEAGKLAI